MQNWYIAIGGQQQGPFTAEEVVQKIRAGAVGRDAHVFAQGMANWEPISSRAEFREAFGGAAPAPTPPVPTSRPGSAHGKIGVTHWAPMSRGTQK